MSRFIFVFKLDFFLIFCYTFLFVGGEHHETKLATWGWLPAKKRPAEAIREPYPRGSTQEKRSASVSTTPESTQAPSSLSYLLKVREGAALQLLGILARGETTTRLRTVGHLGKGGLEKDMPGESALCRAGPRTRRKP